MKSIDELQRIQDEIGELTKDCLIFKTANYQIDRNAVSEGIHPIKKETFQL